MTVAVRRVWAALAAVAAAALIAAAWAPLAVSGSQPAGPATQAARTAQGGSAALVRQVLDNPLNAAAREKLAAIRRQQDADALSAYEALIQGLRAYLEVGPELALPALDRAAQSGRAASLAASLSRPLGRMLAEARQAAKAEASGRIRICPRCGGTGDDDCRAPKCYGSGKVPCEACKATGAVRRDLPGLARSTLVICGACGGSGVVPCDACRGVGVVACAACGKEPDEPATPRVAADEERAVRRVIDQARWLRSGGIDLYTDGAMRPTPK